MAHGMEWNIHFRDLESVLGLILNFLKIEQPILQLIWWD